MRPALPRRRTALHTTARAEEAAAAITVGCEPLPAVVDAVRAVAPDAPRLHPERSSNVALAFEHTPGDPGAA